VLSRLFRRLFLQKLTAAYQTGALKFFGTRAPLAARKAFAAFLAPLRRIEWVVYSKRPFGGPQCVLAYLSRYTHRVAISNRRPISLDHNGVTFKWKDYRAKVMTLAADEFIRRFLIHVLPTGFHRIRHYGLVRQPQARREHRAGASAAQCARATNPGPRSRCRRSTASARASLSVLRQPHDHHRDLPARRYTSISPYNTHSPHLDRHVMNAISTSRPRNAHSVRRRSTGHGGHRPSGPCGVSAPGPVSPARSSLDPPSRPSRRRRAALQG